MEWLEGSFALPASPVYCLWSSLHTPRVGKCSLRVQKNKERQVVVYKASSSGLKTLPFKEFI